MTSPEVSPPPPDVTAYVDLRIYDVSDQEIFDAAVANTVMNLDGWVPREGDTEVLLMEGLALEIAEAIVAVNRIPGAVLQAILLMAGVDKDAGAAPIASATFTLGDTLGHVIPGGTGVYLPLDDGTSVKFLVEPPGLNIPAGSDTGTVSIIGDTFTDSANGVTAGHVMTMTDPVPFIERVELATDVADGRDPESDNDWRDRGVARLSRLSDALVLPRHFVAAALERPEVARAVGIDLWDPLSGNDPGEDPGHMTVAVLGDGGADLSPEAKDAIEQALEARAVAMLDVHVIDVDIEVIPLATDVHLLDGFDAGITVQAVKDALAAYVNPLTWAWGGTIRRNELISLIDQVSGVDYVNDVTINGVAADYALSGPATLPKAGVVTVLVDGS